ncbi:MAG: TetR/AcrR family transcriptional regulator [Actinomycetota bacterium]
MSIRRSQWTADLGLVRPGKQTRSFVTQQALLDSAEQLFYERGEDATTVADIAAQAGVSIGAVYHHFRDKRAVKLALVERFSDTYRATLTAAFDPDRWEGASIGEVVESYLQFSFAAGRARPSFLGSVFRLAAIDADVAGKMRDFRIVADTGLRDLLVARRANIGHPQPEFAVTIAVEQIHSTLRDRLYGAQVPTRLAADRDDAVAAEVARAICAYLKVTDR